MKYSFIFLSFIILFSCVKKESQNDSKVMINEDPTTYYLIRHAEKDRSNAKEKDPELVETGIVRAKKWAAIFSEIELDAVYATPFKRTQQTATPTAISKKIEIQSYEPKAIYKSDFKTITKGKTVLIVGHSNSIPKLTNYLIGEEKYEEIEDSINGNLYIVTIQGTKTWSTLLSLE